MGFQHTAARRRLKQEFDAADREAIVSTHSRPKAAAVGIRPPDVGLHVSTHSRPKAAGSTPFTPNLSSIVSTHSRPKAADHF